MPSPTRAWICASVIRYYRHVRLGQAKPWVAMRLGAPRRLFISRHGVTVGCSGARLGATAACWRQIGQLSGVRGLSSRWTAAVTAAVCDGGCWRHHQVQASQSRTTTNSSPTAHQSGVIGDLTTWFQGKQDFRQSIRRAVRAVKRSACAAWNYPRWREGVPPRSAAESRSRYNRACGAVRRIEAGQSGVIGSSSAARTAAALRASGAITRM